MAPPPQGLAPPPGFKSRPPAPGALRAGSARPQPCAERPARRGPARPGHGECRVPGVRAGRGGGHRADRPVGCTVSPGEGAPEAAPGCAGTRGPVAGSPSRTVPPRVLSPAACPLPRLCHRVWGCPGTGRGWDGAAGTPAAAGWLWGWWDAARSQGMWQQGTVGTGVPVGLCASRATSQHGQGDAPQALLLLCACCHTARCHQGATEPLASPGVPWAERPSLCHLPPL